MRVVSLVPSLTEAIAATRPGALVGATEWCTHPADLDVVRVGGTKNPDVAAVVALAPDLVVANEEENRPVDVEALRAAGLEVDVTHVRDLGSALVELARLAERIGAARPAWLADAERAWGRPWTGARRRGVCLIWRRPWMALGCDTFAGDLLARLGIDNALADAADRYPRVDLAALPPHDVVVLPDEPYRFAVDDGPEAVSAPSRLVSGRHLTWYGPSLVEARDLLAAQLA